MKILMRFSDDVFDDARWMVVKIELINDLTIRTIGWNRILATSL